MQSLAVLVLCFGAAAAAAATPVTVVEDLELQALNEAWSNEDLQTLVPDTAAVPAASRRAVATLLALGALRPADLNRPDLPQRLERLDHALRHPAFMGAIGELSLVDRLEDGWDHADLLDETPLLEVLAAALAKGVITGYDLRRKGVYGGFAPGHTLIYSHSSGLHLRQLAAVLAAHGVRARMFVTPKVSAFLFREGWGTPGPNVRALPGGVKVVNGREVAVLFEFDEPSMRSQFHELVLEYAKKDTENEAGLIADAWWQPFYYTDAPLEGFAGIDLVIVSSDRFEATLTVTADKTQRVLEAVEDRGFPVRVEQVWVNPAFDRFLRGNYR